MCGALLKIPGVGKVDAKEDDANIEVAYDSKIIDVDKLLASMKEAGQPAKKL